MARRMGGKGGIAGDGGTAVKAASASGMAGITAVPEQARIAAPPTRVQEMQVKRLGVEDVRFLNDVAKLSGQRPDAIRDALKTNKPVYYAMEGGRVAAVLVPDMTPAKKSLLLKEFGEKGWERLERYATVSDVYTTLDSYVLDLAVAEGASPEAVRNLMDLARREVLAQGGTEEFLINRIGLAPEALKRFKEEAKSVGSIGGEKPGAFIMRADGSYYYGSGHGFRFIKMVNERGEMYCATRTPEGVKQLEAEIRAQGRELGSAVDAHNHPAGGRMILPSTVDVEIISSRPFKGHLIANYDGAMSYWEPRVAPDGSKTATCISQDYAMLIIRGSPEEMGLAEVLGAKLSESRKEAIFSA